MTYIIIAVTVLVSIACFNDRRLFAALALRPYEVWHRKQWWRLLTHGFVHGDWGHLLVNMIVFWSFGMATENILKTQQVAGVISEWHTTYALLYFGGMAVASVYDVIKRRDDPNYTSIGASGAVSAVVFATIFFSPLSKIYLFGLIPIPGILFGILYLLYESYAGRRSGDGINHYAHIFGAVYGFIFPLLMSPSLIHVFLNGLKF